MQNGGEFNDFPFIGIMITLISMEATLPTFTTSRLILRPLTLSDVPSYEKHFIDYEVIRYLSNAVPWPYPEGGVEWFFKNMIFPSLGKDRWAWGITVKENPAEVIGMVDLWREGKPEHRGFWLGQKFWGKGFMTEAVAPVLTYAFHELGFDQLVFSNALGNPKSRRIKLKTGARFLGTRPAQHVDPQFTVSETWELSKVDWEKHLADQAK